MDLNIQINRVAPQTTGIKFMNIEDTVDCQIW